MDIDIVVLWVDGNDPAWQAEKAKYSPKKIDDSNSVSRFRDWGLMPYWFRAIEQFAPWVRTIHFVTWGHLPSFLNTEHPKLHIVRHQDYIPAEWLPTFSSHTLEMNVHRIPGLSEHFIYFNDDTFLMRPLKETDFFRDDLPCAQATEIPLGFIGRPEVWAFAAANDLGIINQHFKKRTLSRTVKRKLVDRRYHWYDNLRTCSLRFLFPDYFTGFKNFHCPAAFLKRTFETLWQEESELLSTTSSHKFRSKDDVNQWLAQWWQIASGSFAPARLSAANVAITDENIDRILAMISSQQYDMLCLADPEASVAFETMSTAIQQAFAELLPKKSTFER